MDFLKALVAFFAQNGVLSEEVSPDGEGITFLQHLPDEPIEANCISCYDQTLPTLVDKQSGVYHIQVIMRRKKHSDVLNEITALFHFLCSRAEIVEDIDENYYAIFDVRHGPILIGADDNGNWRYSLNFPVTSKTYK